MAKRSVMKQRKESLAQCLRLIRDGRRVIRCGLTGCPEGGWPETEQAKAQLADEIPFWHERSYTVEELVKALYYVDDCMRYRPRQDVLP